MEIDNGPFACAPVAGASYQPLRNLVSAGYVAMKYPATIRPATLTRQDRDTTWTRERPWHGRSGGGLLDAGLLGNALSNRITAIATLLANALMVVTYVRGRAHLKATQMDNVL